MTVAKATSHRYSEEMDAFPAECVCVCVRQQWGLSKQPVSPSISPFHSHVYLMNASTRSWTQTGMCVEDQKKKNGR